MAIPRSAVMSLYSCACCGTAPPAVALCVNPTVKPVIRVTISGLVVSLPDGVNLHNVGDVNGTREVTWASSHWVASFTAGYDASGESPVPTTWTLTVTCTAGNYTVTLLDSHGAGLHYAPTQMMHLAPVASRTGTLYQALGSATVSLLPP